MQAAPGNLRPTPPGLNRTAGKPGWRLRLGDPGVRSEAGGGRGEREGRDAGRGERLTLLLHLQPSSGRGALFTHLLLFLFLRRGLLTLFLLHILHLLRPLVEGADC